MFPERTEIADKKRKIKYNVIMALNLTASKLTLMRTQNIPKKWHS